MKHFIIICITIALCSVASAQTIKTLGYNTTNGQIVTATNVVWTNSFSFSTNVAAAQVRSNLSLGAIWLTNTSATNFRSDIGIPLAALTNTNNASFVRALANSTNPGVPFTGNIVYLDADTSQPYVIEVVNGIIVDNYNQ